MESRHDNCQRLVLAFAMDSIDKPVFGSDSSRPITSQVSLEWLGLSNSLEWISIYVPDQIVDPS
jgi:hypothetical protein